jgi:hypothetical protein
MDSERGNAESSSSQEDHFARFGFRTGLAIKSILCPLAVGFASVGRENGIRESWIHYSGSGLPECGNEAKRASDHF